jgi:hypothetical protein
MTRLALGAKWGKPDRGSAKSLSWDRTLASPRVPKPAPMRLSISRRLVGNLENIRLASQAIKVNT